MRLSVQLRMNFSVTNWNLINKTYNHKVKIKDSQQPKFVQTDFRHAIVSRSLAPDSVLIDIADITDNTETEARRYLHMY